MTPLGRRVVFIIFFITALFLWAEFVEELIK